MQQDGSMAKRQTEKVHDRRSSDLPTNSIVSIAIVADPYSDIGEKIEVLRSVRDDPLAGMLSRNQIDQAQYEAGRQWQRFHEQSEIGSNLRSIDPTKEAVDGGRVPEMLSDAQMKAFRALAGADKELGPLGAGLLRDILGKCMTVSQAALRREFYTQYAVKAIGKHFRWSLERLAIRWGYAQSKQPFLHFDGKSL
jgi:hypothetical protein